MDINGVGVIHCFTNNLALKIVFTVFTVTRALLILHVKKKIINLLNTNFYSKTYFTLAFFCLLHGPASLIPHQFSVNHSYTQHSRQLALTRIILVCSNFKCFILLNVFNKLIRENLITMQQLIDGIHKIEDTST